MRRVACALALSSLLSGCVARVVSVVYPRPETPEMRAKSLALGNLYLLFEKPQDFPVDAVYFARELSRRLSASGGHVLAYRVAREDRTRDPFLERLAPSGALRVRFESLELQRQGVRKQVKVQGKSLKEDVWLFKARLSLKAVLTSEPGGAVLASTQCAVALEEEAPRARDKDKLEWYAARHKRLLARAAAELPRLLGEVPSVERRRWLYSDEKDPLSERAVQEAGRGRWEAASELWAQRLDSGRGGWRELVNLAVAAEQRQEYVEAERIFRKARVGAGPDPQAAKVPFEEILADLASAARDVGLRSKRSVDYFAAPLAVLPFSDETGGFEGAEGLRTSAYRALAKGGYTAVSRVKADRALRGLGARPEELAAKLGAERLLFGSITRSEGAKAAGELRLYERAAGGEVWRSAAGKPLGSGEFVESLLETLPRRTQPFSLP
ncbi:MAG: hypothetical protein WC728_17720 [Elusimicrobiota bacterium]